MTKSFTAAAILLLRDRARLRLDDPIVVHLPWTASIGAPGGAAAITIRDLLTMNAGFPTDDPWGDRQENVPIAEFDALVAAGLSFCRAPRTGFEYSNLGYALLGRIVSVASGVDYREFVAGELLAPLAMHATCFDTRDVAPERRAHGYAPLGAELVPEPVVSPGAFSPMGGLHSSVRDLASWVRGFAQPTDDDAHPLSAADRREMQEGRTHVSTAFVEAPAGAPPKTLTNLYGFGLGATLDSRLGRFVHHSGGYPGFGSHMRWHPASGWGIIALANKTYAPTAVLATAILDDIVTRLGAPTDIAATLWPQTRDAMDIAERLAAGWDDDLADASFAVNLDLDVPRPYRRAAVAQLASAIGPFSRDAATLASRSPAHAKWRVRGATADAEFEILLTPERPPRMQTFAFTAAAPAP